MWLGEVELGAQRPIPPPLLLRASCVISTEGRNLFVNINVISSEESIVFKPTPVILKIKIHLRVASASRLRTLGQSDYSQFLLQPDYSIDCLPAADRILPTAF